MKLLELGEKYLDLVDGWQDGGAEVISTGLLMESTAKYHTDTCLFE